MLLDTLDHVQRLALLARGFRSRWLDTSAGRVHVLDAPGRGEGPPLVVLHGISASAVHFWSVLPALRRFTTRVIAPDLPGHGFSEVPSAGLTPATLSAGLLEAMDAVLDEPVLLFGNSLGGVAAIRYAQARPERVRGLLLCSPGGASTDGGEGLQRFLDSFRMDRPGDAVAFVDKLHARPPWYRRLIAEGVRRRFHRPAMRSFLDHLRPEDLLRPEELRALPVPATLLWGRSDTLMPREHLAFYREHLACDVVEPDDFGHCPYLDRPGALIAQIGAFVGQARPRIAQAL